MKHQLTAIITSAADLPETDQQELAIQIEAMIIERKIAAGEASLLHDSAIDATEAFAIMKQRYAR
jgi:hypothetical protein